MDILRATKLKNGSIDSKDKYLMKSQELKFNTNKL